jgi:hypothetical protein
MAYRSGWISRSVSGPDPSDSRRPQERAATSGSGEPPPGGHLGSSVRLPAEARRLAEALGLPEDLDPHSEGVVEATDAEEPAGEGWQRHGVESYVCLQLLRAAKLSIATGAAIAFT